MLFSGHNMMYHASQHHACALYMTMLAKRDFGRCIITKYIEPTRFEFFHDFFENFKPNRQGMVQTSFCM